MREPAPYPQPAPPASVPAWLVTLLLLFTCLTSSAVTIILTLVATDALATETPGSATPIPTRSGTPLPPITVSGKGQMNSEPLQLVAGDYKIEWTAVEGPQPAGQEGDCYLYGELTPTVGSALNGGIFANRRVEGEEAGTSSVYGVTAGRYYITMRTTCLDWSVTVTQY